MGYRRSEVDAELAKRDVAMAATERALQEARAKADDLEKVTERLSATVVERERELRELRQEVATLRESGVEGVRSLVAMGRQLEEIRTQARGQATQIRLRALRDAANLVDRVSDVLDFAPDDIQPAPTLGLGGGSRFVRGLIRHQDRFLLVLDLDRVFSALLEAPSNEAP